MLKRYIIGLLFLIALMPSLARADTRSEPPKAVPDRVEFHRAAVAPFLVGRRHPQMDESMDQTVTCSIEQICQYDPNIAANAGPTLTRLVYEYLRRRFGDRIVDRQAVAKAYSVLALDQHLDTPRSLAMKLGSKLGADAVFVGTVWRYRDRGALKEIRDSPATVAFAVYLIDTKSGQQMWRGLYEVTQRPISENLLQAGKLLKLGLKWRTADELAQIGVEEAFKDFPHQ